MADGIGIWLLHDPDYPDDPACDWFAVMADGNSPDDPPTHIAYPADVARARDAVVEAARRVDAGAPESLLERLELSIALAGLDAAEGGAG